MWNPKQVAVMHCKGHQQGMSEEAVGNRLADKAAREAAVSCQVTLLAPLVQIDLNDYKLVYNTPQVVKVATEQLKATLNKGWYVLPDNSLCA